MSKRNDSNPILPLTLDDIPKNLPNVSNSSQNDRFSMISSNQGSIPSVSTYAQRQSKRSQLKKIRENLNTRIKVPKYFKRMLIFNSLDFETAFWEMLNLLHSPKRVYKSLYYQKQTKNKWSRDDPSFVLILCFLLIISAIFWGLMYTSGVLGILKLVLYMVIVDFILFGLVIATIGWIFANKFLLQSDAHIMGESLSNNSILNFIHKFIVFDSILEWSYCFDVHCNAYLIIWLCLYFIQFFFIPLITMNNIFSTIIGNSLYFIALSYYFLITFYGYNALPFLQKTEYLLAPVILFVITWLILTISGINIANIMCDSYFN